MYNIIVDCKSVMSVDTDNRSVARLTARKAGYRVCELEQVSTIPGKAEYDKYLQIVSTGIPAERENRDLIMEMVLGSDDIKETVWSLTDEETEAAENYARFLGETVYREFLADKKRIKGE